MLEIKDENLFYIGGIVRDKLLDKVSFDTDLVYVGNAIEFVKTLNDITVLQINEDFGTVRIKCAQETVDIASTRCEIYPQKGHLPQITKIGCSLKEDILRRDFTINSLALSTKTGEIIDYTGGIEDLNSKKLRVLHDNSFIDDPTRILRALKFSIRFGFDIESKTKQLMEEYLRNINYDISYKRLKKELMETFNLNSWIGFKKFVDMGIYKLIAPNSFEIPHFDFSNLIKKLNPENIWIIYVGLLPDISSIPLTKTESKILSDFQILKTKNYMTDFEIYKAFSNVRDESVIMYSTVNNSIVNHYHQNLKNIKLQINGADLKNLGFPPSEKYQKCFDFVLDKKIKNPKISKQDEICLAKEFFEK